MLAGSGHDKRVIPCYWFDDVNGKYKHGRSDEGRCKKMIGYSVDD